MNHTKDMQKGFTLIELLIVIAILGILSVIGINNFLTARTKALDSQRKADLQTISKTLEAYVNDHKAYPTTAELPAWGQPFTDSNGTVYAAKLPADPTGHTYKYVPASDSKSYTLYAHLDNTQDPSIITPPLNPVIACGTAATPCNYKITSSNIQ